MGQCEDHVQVARREKFSSTCSDPAVPSSGLTLRAMAIAAAVIGDGGTMSAAGALIEMTAECGGTTPANDLRAAVNPMDSRPNASDVGRDADSGPSLSDRYDLTGFEWCAGQHHPRVDASQNSDEACEDEHLSGGPLAGRLPCKRSTPPWCRSAYHRYASGCLETAMRLACAVIRASAPAAPRVVLG